MGLKSRLKRLENGSTGTRCSECGTARNDRVTFAMVAGEVWDVYPEPLLCGGCRRVLKFTLKLGDAGPKPDLEHATSG